MHTASKAKAFLLILIIFGAIAGFVYWASAINDRYEAMPKQFTIGQRVITKVGQREGMVVGYRYAECRSSYDDPACQWYRVTLATPNGFENMFLYSMFLEAAP